MCSQFKDLFSRLSSGDAANPRTFYSHIRHPLAHVSGGTATLDDAGRCKWI